MFLSNSGIQIFLCELTYSSTMALGLKMFSNLNNFRALAINSDYDLEKYETFFCGSYFCLPDLGLGFVFGKGRRLN